MWEKRTDAMLRILTRDRHIIRVDELRRAIESIPPKDYETMSYYERWITAIETLIIEKGLLTRDEIDRRVETSRLPDTCRKNRMEPQFKPGDRVRIRVDYPARHFRTPGYIRARPAPSRPCMALFAIRKRSPMVVTVAKQFLYLVCFEQTHVWGAYPASPDKLYIDIYEPWLEPA